MYPNKFKANVLKFLSLHIMWTVKKKSLLNYLIKQSKLIKNKKPKHALTWRDNNSLKRSKSLVCRHIKEEKELTK